MNTYPAIEFLLRHKRPLPAAAAVMGGMIGVWIFLRTGILDFLFAGVLLGGLAFVLVRSGLELLSVISDMLIPK
jgi:hypothetical protein